MEKKSKELEVAIRATLEAGKILEKYFETELEKGFKDDKSMVTVADTESEEVIKKIISESFPKHSILGEETGLLQNDSEYKWHIDPIDGTNNFANGIPIFAVSVAFEHKGQILVGVVYNPATRNLFYAEKGKGAYCNEKRIYVSKDGKEKAIVTSSPSRNESNRKLHRKLNYVLPNLVSSVRNLGSTAVELSYVARGSIEANIQIGLSTFDFAAGVLLVEEAGGKITDFNGEIYKFPENYFIASNGIFHDLLVDEVNKQKEELNI